MGAFHKENEMNKANKTEWNECPDCTFAKSIGRLKGALSNPSIRVVALWGIGKIAIKTKHERILEDGKIWLICTICQSESTVDYLDEFYGDN